VWRGSGLHLGQHGARRAGGERGLAGHRNDRPLADGGQLRGTFSLRVLRRAGGATLQAQATGDWVEIKTSTTQTQVFPAHLPIQAGDLIGVDYGYGKHLATASYPESSFAYWSPP
jgi:hypothetical protein